MKQKLLKIVKSLWVWVGIVVVCLAGLLVFWIGKGNERIFDYVPQGVDQAIVIKVNPNNTLLYKNYMQNLPGNIESLFADIDIVVITQKTVDAVTENLIFVQSKPGFKPQDLVDSMNGSGEVEYIYQTVEENLYVFAKPDSLKYLKLDRENNFFSIDVLQKFSSLLNSSEISFFSHVSATNDVGFVGPFLANVDYFVYGIDMQGPKMDMEAHLIYKEKVVLDSSYKFKPLFNGYSNDKNLVFLEFGNVVKQLGTDKETLVASIQALMQLLGVENLTAEDYDVIYATLSNNMWLLVGEGNNFAGAGMSLLFRNQSKTKGWSDFFSVLTKMMPAAYSFVSATPFMSWAQTALVHDINKQWFTAQVFGVEDVGVYTEKIWEDVLLTLWDPVVESNKNSDVDFDSQTLWYFKINFSPVLDLYKRFKSSLASLSPLWQAAWEEDFSFFENKSLQGQIVASEDGVSIEAVLE